VDAVTVLASPLDRISEQARPYPADMLRPHRTGLCLFAAAYLGHNDAIHMARKDMVVTCVDTDRRRLSEMSHLYPDDWQFVAADAWEFAKQARRDRLEWDFVSVDTFTGDATDRSMESLELWCSLARKAVTATFAVKSGTGWASPAGWRVSLFPRSDLASWLVLRRD
jgi:hypothetical protein